ncbi:MAG: META domain-containing protein [Chromatiales bacterium]|nr:META domain-containing protein [Chromatiales bacterium]
MRLVVAFAAIAVVLLAGCAGTAAKSGPTLAGTSWKLDRWSDANVDPRGFTITATFADGRVAGKAAVNNYFAAYTEGPAGRFTVSQAGSTMMAGPAAAMQAEKIYLALLVQAKAYSRTGTELTLADAEGNLLLVFAPVPAMP